MGSTNILFEATYSVKIKAIVYKLLKNKKTLAKLYMINLKQLPTDLKLS